MSGVDYQPALHECTDLLSRALLEKLPKSPSKGIPLLRRKRKEGYALSFPFTLKEAFPRPAIMHMACRQAHKAVNAYVARDFQGYGDLGVRAVAAEAMRGNA